MPFTARVFWAGFAMAHSMFAGIATVHHNWSAVWQQLLLASLFVLLYSYERRLGTAIDREAFWRDECRKERRYSMDILRRNGELQTENIRLHDQMREHWAFLGPNSSSSL